ncbi:MAG: T9SS type A sorting domain-containing protein [Saprospiraceae bacterium]|nr:T9SS type A sorting domain-containing protein [Saprospiraceae bacterium]
MKKYIVFLCFLFIGALFFVQQNVKTVETVDDGDSIEIGKLTGAEKFALYHHLIRKSPKDSPYAYSTGYQGKEYEKLKKRLPESEARDLTWEERGPGNASGRSRSIWIDPRDATGETWFVGSAQGGVWKTEDGGNTYEIKTPNVPHLGTSVIMGCQSVPEVIYAGSGEGFNNLSTAGAGIYKSVDGGETWTVLESTVGNSSFSNVLRMAVDPSDPNIVFAATRNNNTSSDVQGFVMRSKDGGESWEEVLFHFDIIPHIVMSPEDGNVLYAGLNQEGVLKTVDGGDNWDFVWLFESPELRPGRIEIAVSPSDPNFVYFTTPIDDQEFSPGDKIFVSSDAGANFQEVIANNAKDDYSNFSFRQSFWNKTIAVDPFNPQKIYFGGTSALLSMEVQVFEGLAIGEMDVIVDGYSQYEEFYETSTKGVHVDHHGIYFSVVDAENEEFILINVNDGGVAVSRDKGATFTQTGDTFLLGFNPEGVEWTTVDGYNVSTFYGVDKMNGSDRYVGGTQDNGSWVSPENPDETSNWAYAPSGDGFEAAWNYNDPNQIIESSQINNFFKSIDGGASWFPLETPGRFGPFITTIANSKQDGDMIMISTFDGPALSTDFGRNWITSEVPETYMFSGLRTPIDISLINPEVVWTGTGMVSDSRICVSQDGGMTFTETSPYIEQELGVVAGIATHPSDDATAYALFGTAGQPKIVRTTDFGQTWEDISGFEGTIDGTSSRGFPDVSVFSLLVMPYDNNIIWAGTEIGIVESLDKGATWNLIDDDLPATAIWEMKIVNDEVVLATHGRGIWTVSLAELEGYEPPELSLWAPQFAGNIFDKKVTGALRHLTPADSGSFTVTVETFEETFSETFSFGNVASPFLQPFEMDLEYFDTEDYIYDAKVEIRAYKNGEVKVRNSEFLFYDVDIDDKVENYLDDFNDGNEDFAVRRVSEATADFSVGTPNGFGNNGLESVHSLEINRTYQAIFQKPIIIPASGSNISFDEIVLLQPFVEFGFSRYLESIVLEATNNKGQNWVFLDQYSSEENADWEIANSEGTAPTDELYSNRTIRLSDFFEEGDEVYFRLNMVITINSNSWGYILDNFMVSSTVSTAETQLQDKIAIKTYMNPFVDRTRIEVLHSNPNQLGKTELVDMNGRTMEVSFSATQNQNGTIYEMDGLGLSPGIYLFRVQVGDNYFTEKLVKL